MPKKPFQRVAFPENNSDPDSMARHLSNPDPHPMYMKSNAPLGVIYPILFRNAEDFRKMPVTTSAGLFNPSLVFYIGVNEVTDDITGQTFAPFHPYSYDGMTMDVNGTSYPVWRDQISSFGDFTSAIRAAILAHANDSDGNPNRVHPSLALANHTHTASSITDLLSAVRNAVSEGYVSLFTQSTDFNGVHADKKTVLYSGYDTDLYKCGHIYKYNGATAVWEDKSPAGGSGGGTIDTSTLVADHNNDQNGFTHTNLPFAAKSDFENVKSEVETITASLNRESQYWILDQNGEDGSEEISLDVYSYVTVYTTLPRLMQELEKYSEEVTHFVMVKPGVYSFDGRNATWRKLRIQFSRASLPSNQQTSDPCVFVSSILGSSSPDIPIIHNYGYIEDCVLDFNNITFVGGWGFRDSFVNLTDCTIYRYSTSQNYPRHLLSVLSFRRCIADLNKVNLTTDLIVKNSNVLVATDTDIKLSKCNFLEASVVQTEESNANCLVFRNRTHFEIEMCKFTGWGGIAIDVKSGSYGTISTTNVLGDTGVQVVDASVELRGTNSIIGRKAGVFGNNAKIKTSTENITYNRPYIVSEGVYGDDATHPIDTAGILLTNRSFGEFVACDVTSRTEGADVSVCVKLDLMSSATFTRCGLVGENSCRYGIQAVNMAQAVVDGATSYRGVSSRFNIDPNSLSLDGSRINLLSS